MANTIFWGKDFKVTKYVLITDLQGLSICNFR